MNKFLYLPIFVLLLAGCNKGNKTTKLKPLFPGVADSSKSIIISNRLPSLPVNRKGTVTISVPEQRDYSIEDLVDQYSYICLETTKESLIGNIDQICRDSIFLFILDKRSKSVLRFDTTGHFLSRIGSKGKGPKEYISPSRIALDKSRREICILDDDAWKLEYFNYNGDHLRTTPMYFDFSDLAFWGKRIILRARTDENGKWEPIDKKEVLICDNNYKPLLTLFERPKDLSKDFHCEAVKPLKRFYDGIYFSTMLSDTIWRITNKSCDAMFVLKFPSRGKFIENDKLNELTDKKYEELINSEICFLGEYGITPNISYFFIKIKDKYRSILSLIYNRKTRHIIYGKKSYPFLNRFKRLGDYFFDGIDFTGDDGTFINVQQPNNMISIFKSLNKRDLSFLPQKDKKMMEQIGEKDNPVLMIVKVKDF